MTLTTSAVATGTVAMATVLAAQAKAAGVTIKISNVPSGVFFGPDYLKWTFGQDYYNYYPYLAQVAESMLAGLTVQRDAYQQCPLHQPLQPGERDRGPVAAQRDPARDADVRLQRGRLPHPRLH